MGTMKSYISTDYNVIYYIAHMIQSRYICIKFQAIKVEVQWYDRKLGHSVFLWDISPIYAKMISAGGCIIP